MVTHKGRTMRQDDKNHFLLTEMPYCIFIETFNLNILHFQSAFKNQARFNLAKTFLVVKFKVHSEIVVSRKISKIFDQF